MKELQKYNINPKYIIVKPNWVCDQIGRATEALILDEVLSSFPSSNKIVVESFTPWRTKTYKGLKKDLNEGILDLEKYIYLDENFLKNSGNQKILDKHKAEYINITKEYWNDACVSPEELLLNYADLENIQNQEFLSYIPKNLFEIRQKSLFISLAKVKLEIQNTGVLVSLSMKNLFGLIPDPSRKKYHGENYEKVFDVVRQLYKIYSTVFSHNLWINDRSLSL